MLFPVSLPVNGTTFLLLVLLQPWNYPLTFIPQVLAVPSSECVLKSFVCDYHPVLTILISCLGYSSNLSFVLVHTTDSHFIYYLFLSLLLLLILGIEPRGT